MILGIFLAFVKWTILIYQYIYVYLNENHKSYKLEKTLLCSENSHITDEKLSLKDVKCFVHKKFQALKN